MASRLYLRHADRQPEERILEKTGVTFKSGHVQPFLIDRYADLVFKAEVLENLAQHPLHLRRLLDTIPILDRRALDFILPKVSRKSLLALPRLHSILHTCVLPTFTASLLPLPLPLLLLLHPLQHLRPLHILHKMPIFPPHPRNIRPQPRRPLRILIRNLVRQMMPFEALQILDIPHIVMIPASLLPADNLRVQRLGAELGVLFGREFDPAVDEGAFLVAAGLGALRVGRGGFGRQEDLGGGAEGGEQVADGVWLHEGRDAREVDDAGFAGSARGGLEVFGGQWLEVALWCFGGLLGGR